MSEFIQTWFPPFTGVVGVLAIIAAFWVRATSKAEAESVVADMRAEFDKSIAGLVEDFKELEGKVIQHDRALIGLNRGFDFLPTAVDISNLKDQLSEISGNLKGLTEKVSGVQEGQRRTEDAMAVINAALITTPGSPHGGKR